MMEITSDVSGMVWDALLSVEGGLPDDILLSIPESVLLERDGEAAIRHIGARVLTTSDQSVAALSSWYNDPTPLVKPSAITHSLMEWLRVTEQLKADGAEPSAVQQRISLMALMGRIPEVARAIEALQAMHDTVTVQHLVKAIERIGNRHSSLSNQKRAIAMMVGGAEDTDGGSSSGGGSGRSRRQRETALVAVKKPKFGRCKFHDHSSCKYGERCRFNHVGEAGNGHPPPAGHSAPQAYTPPPAAAEADATEAAVANLAEVLSRMLAGVAARTCISVALVADVLSSSLQRRMTRRRNEYSHSSCDAPAGTTDINLVTGSNMGGVNVLTGSALSVRVVCDTAATMPVAGADLQGLVGTLNKTPVTIALETADGTTIVTEAVDVPNAKGLMNKSLVVKNCARSLCHVVAVCESQSLGFQIDSGATGATFLSDESTFLELEREGDFFTFEVPTESDYESCDEGSLESWNGGGVPIESEWSCVECTDDHAAVLLASSGSVQSAFVAKFDLVQHCADGIAHTMRSARGVYRLV
jgi:hypothetical protein